jgi:hypothetical protein
LENEVVTKTIRNNEHLFDIVTPINVNCLASLLTNHPNQPYVQSVLAGLCEGFWPWANTQHDTYPITQDYYKQHEFDNDTTQFLISQHDKEIRLNCFSESFSTNLLLGMYAMAIHVIPKPHLTNLRLISNLSASEYAPNTMINKANVSNLPLDTITKLGTALVSFCRAHGDAKLMMWKSDVSQAYHRMPIHKHWQIKQIHMIDGECHIDHCNNFGGKGGYKIWSAFMCLVIWIGWYIMKIRFWVYIDDNFGFERAEAHTFHARLNCQLLLQQARLLDLWDDINLPYEDKKQEWGPTLRAIGFDVDPNTMTVAIPDDACKIFLLHISEFINIIGTDRRHTLHEFQSLASYANWIFNIYTLG